MILLRLAQSMVRQPVRAVASVAVALVVLAGAKLADHETDLNDDWKSADPSKPVMCNDYECRQGHEYVDPPVEGQACGRRPAHRVWRYTGDHRHQAVFTCRDGLNR